MWQPLRLLNPGDTSGSRHASPANANANANNEVVTQAHNSRIVLAKS